MKVLLIFTLAVTISTSHARRLISGDAKIVQPGEHTSVVEIQRNGDPGHCTGSLISPNLVLTAQHCFEDAPTAKYTVKLPPLSPGDAGKVLGVSKVVLHEDYMNINGDINAISKLDRLIGNCDCRKNWEYNGEKYFGCDERSPDSATPWCMTRGKCTSSPGKTFKMCRLGEETGWQAGLLRLRKAFKLLLKIAETFGRGEGFTIFRGDLAVVYLDTSIMDRRLMKIARTSEDLTCSVAEAVGYGKTVNQGIWDRSSGKNSAYDGAARKAMCRVLSPDTCSYAFTKLAGEWLMKHYFSNPNAWYSVLKRPVFAALNSAVSRAHDLKNKGVICASPTTPELQLAMPGDSGGPLILNNEQIGVVSGSGGFMSSGKGILEYYVELSHYREWIHQHVALSKLQRRHPTKLRSRRNLRLHRRLMPWVAPVQTALGLTTKAKAWELVEMLQERDQCPVVYEDFDQAAEEIKALQSELTALKQHLQGSQKKLAAAQTEITSLKKDNSGLRVNLDAVQRSRKREADGYEKELGGLRIELQKCKKEGEEWKRQVDSLSGDEAKTKQVLEEMERELDGAGEKIEEQRAEIARLRNARNRLTGETQTRLDAAKADYQASIERLKAQHAQQIEEMRKAHQAELEALKSTCNSELKAAETKATKAAEETERCTMKGGAGNIGHQNPSESRASCARSCKSKANQAKSDNYLCTWGSMVLHTYPIRHCVIKGGAGKKKVDEPLTRYKCNVHCYKTFSKSKFCKFGNEITKCKAINKIKCPRGPGTGHRL